MGYLIGYSESRLMITYEELQIEAKEAANKRFEYLELLRRHANGFIEHYIQSLGVAGNPTFSGWDGKTEKIVSVGDVDNGKFVEKYLHEFGLKENFEIKFLLKTTINTSSPQNQWVIVPVVISSIKGKTLFVIGSGDTAKSCNIPEGNTLAIYKEAAEALKVLLIDIIKSTAP